MPSVVVFWTTSTIKDEKSAAKFHYTKSVSGNFVEPLPFEWYQYVGRATTLHPEILPASDLPSPVNGILWEMSELITQEQIAVESSNFAQGLIT